MTFQNATETKEEFEMCCDCAHCNCCSRCYCNTRIRDSIGNAVQQLVSASRNAGSGIYEQAVRMEKAFGMMTAVADLFDKYKKPPQDVLESLYQPMRNGLSEANKAYEKYAGESGRCHEILRNMVEAFSWPALCSVPEACIRNIKEMTEEIQNENVEKRDDLPDRWCERIKEILAGVEMHIRSYYQKKETWNVDGQIFDLKDDAIFPVMRQAPSDGDPSTMLDGMKWMIRNYTGARNIDLAEMEQRHSAYIYNCRDSVIKAHGKINAITVENCKNVGIVIDDVISSIEIVRCASCELQIIGHAPTLSLESVQGFCVYYSTGCVGSTKLLATRCFNVRVKVPMENGDYRELFVPDQFTYVVNADGSGLSAKPVVHCGSG